jgi:hypothetical protein
MIESQNWPGMNPRIHHFIVKDERDRHGDAVWILEIKAMMMSVGIFVCFVDGNSDDERSDDDCRAPMRHDCQACGCAQARTKQSRPSEDPY